MLSDIEIAESAKLKPITEIAASIGIKSAELYHYGKYMAKVESRAYKTPPKDGKLILVTAINPTKSGEGKTTISIGLADALRRIGKKSVLALREPSLGPVFGIKGGAAGGGYSQIAPMADINLRFTGDFDAIEKANNLLCAAIDNNIFFESPLELDHERIIFKRCTDMNDRALRNIELRVAAAGGKNYTRNEGFNITAASEIMAVLCLSSDFADMKRRLSEIVVGYDKRGNIVKCGDLNCVDAMAILLSGALKPNLVQTLEGTPAFVHGGPFANIAHGCNSIIATREALKRADYVVTEAGFGADLGAEKFIDIKSRVGGFDISCVVVVATVKALKLNGGAASEDLLGENIGALKRGIPNLTRHIRNIAEVFKLPVIVAVNRFDSDTEGEIAEISRAANDAGAKCCSAESFLKGGEGALDLAESVLKTADSPKGPTEFCYEIGDDYRVKLDKIARRVYGADGAVIEPRAENRLKEIEKAGYGGLYVCVAKTQYSFSDDPTLLGAPTGFCLRVKDIELRAGAGFIVAVCGNMILMPALSKNPGYLFMSISDDGNTIRGLS
ncbi:MAG: formate--tetrahydrofolate ligase [Clostridiales bacterium]|jgi:formate--tetrahydrofolate ligase|nr:formate--tetrahydrofolate ligase [Clostridiales bacterium]